MSLYEDSLPSPDEEGEARTTLFDRGWDGQLVFTDIRTVTDSMITGGLVAGYTAPRSTALPEVVPLESSLARKDGRTWKKFDPAESQLPTDFITACYTEEVKVELKRIRDEHPDLLRTPARETDRTNLAVIAILCNTHFTTPRGLNKHTERMHGGVSIRRLPPAIPIPDRTTPTSRTAYIPPPTHAEAQPFYGPMNPGTMPEFLNSKLFVKAKKGTSIKEITKRWSAVTRKMTNELRGTTQKHVHSGNRPQ